jgi:hypothetical protein
MMQDKERKKMPRREKTVIGYRFAEEKNNHEFIPLDACHLMGGHEETLKI